MIQKFWSARDQNHFDTRLETHMILGALSNMLPHRRLSHWPKIENIYQGNRSSRHFLNCYVEKLMVIFAEFYFTCKTDVWKSWTTSFTIWLCHDFVKPSGKLAFFVHFAGSPSRTSSLPEFEIKYEWWTRINLCNNLFRVIWFVASWFTGKKG